MCADPFDAGALELAGRSPEEWGVPRWRALVCYVHQARRGPAACCPHAACCRCCLAAPSALTKQPSCRACGHKESQRLWLLCPLCAAEPRGAQGHPSRALLPAAAVQGAGEARPAHVAAGDRALLRCRPGAALCRPPAAAALPWAWPARRPRIPRCPSPTAMRRPPLLAAARPPARRPSGARAPAGAGAERAEPAVGGALGEGRAS